MLISPGHHIIVAQKSNGRTHQEQLYVSNNMRLFIWLNFNRLTQFRLDNKKNKSRERRRHQCRLVKDNELFIVVPNSRERSTYTLFRWINAKTFP